ncbi:uncharacterized protein [Montipora capricornis]|uniref:uncharacterized protein isoform X1 n=1 Tax=Montipora capricornis TaxID=246305 RepID=UPI0035F1302B
MTVGEDQKQRLLLWILLNFVSAHITALAKVAPFCVKQATHYNTILRSGLEAGVYRPWEPRDVGNMTVDKCTEHCCQSPDTDTVFLLNSYCFCVKCHSVQLCASEKIIPPSGYKPVLVIVMKSVSKLATTSKPLTYSRISRRIKQTEPSSKSTTLRHNQKETERTTREPENVSTKFTATTSVGGLRRRTGEDHANFAELRNANLPVPNGYSQTKDGPKSAADSSHSGVISQSIKTTQRNIDLNITTPTGPTTPRPTRQVTTEKKVEGTGNDDISLQCPGTLKVIRVLAFGIPGDSQTIKDFDKHCQANLAQIDETNVCIVSLKRVYKSSYPPFIKTLVTYTCSYTEFVS